MDRKWFDVFLTDLFGAYGRSVDRVILGSYYRRLEGFGQEVVERATATAEKTCLQHPPTAPELVAHCKAAAKTGAAAVIPAAIQIEESTGGLCSPEEARKAIREKLGIDL